MKCERCGKELSGLDLYCDRCGKAIFPEYMDETDVWAYYKTDEELEAILKEEEQQQQQPEQEEKSFDEPLELDEETIEEELLEEIIEDTEDGLEISQVEKTEEPDDSPENFVSEKTEEKDISENISEEFSEESKEEELEESENLEDTEDEWDFDSDEDETDSEEIEAKPILTPEMKKARSLRRWAIAVFLISCLGIGVFLGFQRVQKMERQEKAYQEELAKNENSKPVVKPEPEEKKEPVKEEPKKEEPKKEEPKKEEPKKEEPKKEEPKKNFFKVEDVKTIDLKKYKKLSAAKTEENSVKVSESYDYSAKSAVDGDISSSWQENEEGTGEGKGFKILLDQSHKVRYLVFHLGNWRSDQLWDYNARPKTLTIQVGDGQKKDVEFPNKKEVFCLSFDEPVEASYVSVYIKEAYKGSRWQDNCISEVEIFE